MTESQKNHRAPLARGEIRTHTVGDQTFQVMHIAGPRVQARVGVPGGQPSMVLCTDTDAAVAVRAYADAIDGAERIQAHLREAAALSYNLPDGADMALVTGEPIRSTPQVITPDPGVQVEYESDERPTPSLADACCASTSKGGITTHKNECPRFARLTDEEAAYRRHLLDVDKRPAPSLADDVAALRGMIEQQGRLGRQPSRLEMLAVLDRIAAQMPQPTRAWMHRCGMVLIDDVSPPLPCDGCRGPGAWRRLYTLGGERA